MCERERVPSNTPIETMFERESSACVRVNYVRESSARK